MKILINFLIGYKWKTKKESIGMNNINNSYWDKVENAVTEGTVNFSDTDSIILYAFSVST